MISPQAVAVGIAWSGGTLTVLGDAPPGCGLVVRVRGEEHREEWVSRVPKGPFWLPGERLVLEAAPSLWLVRSEAPLDELLLPEEAAAAALGEGGLLQALGPSGERLYLGQELLRRWRVSGRYVAEDAGILREGNRFRTTFHLPPQVSEGVLEVAVFACRDGRVFDVGRQSVAVRRVGLAALLTGAARRHAALYGTLAALGALALGTLVGLTFPGGRVR